MRRKGFVFDKHHGSQEWLTVFCMQMEAFPSQYSVWTHIIFYDWPKSIQIIFKWKGIQDFNPSPLPLQPPKDPEHRWERGVAE